MSPVTSPEEKEQPERRRVEKLAADVHRWGWLERRADRLLQCEARSWTQARNWLRAMACQRPLVRG